MGEGEGSGGEWGVRFGLWGFGFCGYVRGCFVVGLLAIFFYCSRNVYLIRAGGGIFK